MGTLVLTCLKSIVTSEKDTCEYLDETLSFILSYSFLLLVLGSKTYEFWAYFKYVKISLTNYFKKG
jgi:hypothetical protein